VRLDLAGADEFSVVVCQSLPGTDPYTPRSSRLQWVLIVQETDVLPVNGGDPLYLCYWMRQSGLADLLPTLRGTMIEPLSGVSGGPIQNPSPLASRASAARPEFACR
jgi:hypothetical protein